MPAITLTDQEAQAAIQLFDLAVKSGGLQVAKAAVVLTDKIADAINRSQAGKAAEDSEPEPDIAAI